jgi:hypothetical protein
MNSEVLGQNPRFKYILDHWPPLHYGLDKKKINVQKNV